MENTKPLVSIVVPAYNEAAIVHDNLKALCDYMKSIENEYPWELIFVNDGSVDKTGELAEEFAKKRNNMHVLHHFVNFQLGQALRFAFKNCKGDYVIVMDIDLSYSPDHIGKLLQKIRETKAKIVIASPYAEGGKISNVPLLRRMFSTFANRFLSVAAKGKLTTLTGMVRAYDRIFLDSLNLKAMDYEINPEIIYKTQMLRGRIVEIPAHLNWSVIKSVGNKRKSSMKISRNVISSLFTGFLFRPFMFFILPGLLLLIMSLYPMFWALAHSLSYFDRVSSKDIFFIQKISEAIASAFQLSPQSFIIGGIAILVALQLISLGIISLQKKRYFEELFHLETTILRSILNK